MTTGTISDLYHAPGATAADQSTLVYVWQGAQSVFDTLMVTGALLALPALILLGVAMLRSPVFGTAYGWAGSAIGAVGLGGASMGLVDPLLGGVTASILGLMAFNLVVGWKTYRVAMPSSRGSA